MIMNRWTRTKAYLGRFFTSWTAWDSAPAYSALDLADGCKP